MILKIALVNVNVKGGIKSFVKALFFLLKMLYNIFNITYFSLELKMKGMSENEK